MLPLDLLQILLIRRSILEHTLHRLCLPAILGAFLPSVQLSRTSRARTSGVRKTPNLAGSYSKKIRSCYSGQTQPLILLQSRRIGHTFHHRLCVCSLRSRNSLRRDQLLDWWKAMPSRASKSSRLRAARRELNLFNNPEP